MKTKIILLIILFYLKGFSQETYTVSGYISDSRNGKALIGANVSTHSSNINFTTNKFGYYSLTLPEGRNIIIINYSDYTCQTIEIHLEKNITLNFGMNSHQYHWRNIKSSWQIYIQSLSNSSGLSFPG